MNPSPMDDLSIGELMRRLDRLEQQIDARFLTAARQMESLQFVGRDYYEAAHKALADRVDGLSDRIDKQDDERARFRLALLASFISPIVVAFIVATWVTR